MSSVLEVRGLSKNFPAGGVLHRAKLHAVDDVTFALEPGRITALAGESGSGKSTVARLIARLYDPTSGEVLFEGRDVASDRGRREVLRYRSQVQMIFQDPFGSLNPTKTVRAHLERPLRIHGLGASRDVEERVHELLETVGLVPPAHYAGEVPAPALGRPASARRDRARAGGRAAGAHRRRADLDARRLDPRRDPQPDARPQGYAASRSSMSRTTWRARATSPTTSSSCTPARSSSRGRSRRCSRIRCTRTRAC